MVKNLSQLNISDIKNLYNRAMQWADDNPFKSVALCGLFFTLGFAPFFFWPLAICALAFLLSLIYKSNIKQTASCAFVFAFTHHLTALYWIPRSFMVDMESFWLGLVYGTPALVAVAGVLTLFIVIPLVFARLFSKYAYIIGILAVMFWMAGEFARGVIFPWNLSGYIWANNLWLMQHASIGTVYLMSAFVLCAAYLLSIKKYGIYISLVFVSVLMVSGAYIFNTYEVNLIETGKSVRLVQANISQAHKWDTQKRYALVDRHLELSMGSKDAPVADITIWPETAIPFVLEEQPFFRKNVSFFMKEGQTLVAGSLKRVTENGNLTYRNSIFTLDHKGNVVDSYDKHILVPFGEYIPLRKFVPAIFKPMVYGKVDYSRGEKPASLKVSHNVTALPLICFEAIFPFFVKNNRNNNQFILNITNDAWFDKTTSPYQHFAMARLRAVESRLPMIRIANTGITSIIHPQGVIEKRIKIRQPMFVQKELAIKQ